MSLPALTHAELFAVDASATLAAIAQLDCPICAHPIGLHSLAGACEICDCTGVLSVAIVEPDDDGDPGPAPEFP